jgi:hypothetical protein
MAVVVMVVDGGGRVVVVELHGSSGRALYGDPLCGAGDVGFRGTEAVACPSAELYRVWYRDCRHCRVGGAHAQFYGL